jgi:hypothetical protein
MEDPRKQMQAALKQAMKDKDTVTRDVIRMTMSALKQEEVDSQKELDAEGASKILMKEVKKRRDAIEELEQAGREDLLEKERRELAIIEQFLPEQMSREEIESIVDDVIAQTGASSQRDMGKVMGAVMPKVRGKADGKLVNEVVREKLQG